MKSSICSRTDFSVGKRSRVCSICSSSTRKVSAGGPRPVICSRRIIDFSHQSGSSLLVMWSIFCPAKAR
ncbi:hypothetical protein AAHB37_14240 [Glutamicibacter halophytocola]|uniref:hypothetical protein n=1 Tax=Glutamicibacter halophytocola TaxID=1933880 RepID=UPI003218E22A